jgi:hypothetical protein
MPVRGFIYVMTNPTMIGLAKVGMTTRDPGSRQDELSRATGVASPFTLAFLQPVVNCRAAERWVHENLELAGYRHAPNREFFNAPLHEIVRIVAAAGLIGADETDGDAGQLGPDTAVEAHHLDGPALKDLGDAHMDGRGVIKDPATALRYYQLALHAKQWDALPPASSILRGHHGLKADPKAELELLNAAIAADQWWFLPLAASLFASQGQFDIQSAQGAWITYFSKCLQLVQQLEEDGSPQAIEQAATLRNEAAQTALEALEFAVDGHFDTSERGWWKVIYMLHEQIEEAVVRKYGANPPEHLSDRKEALLLQLIAAQLTYVNSGS